MTQAAAIRQLNPNLGAVGLRTHRVDRAPSGPGRAGRAAGAETRRARLVTLAVLLVGAWLVLTIAPALVLGAPAAPPAPTGDQGFPAPGLAQPHLMAVSLVKAVLLLLFAAGVFYILDWAFLDIAFVHANPMPWGGVVLAGGVLGAAAVFLVPIFWIGLPLGLVITGGAALVYANHRNTLVAPALKVLTAAHRERFKARLKGIKTETEDDSGQIFGVGRDIIFMGLDDLPIRADTSTEPKRQAAHELERVMHDAVSKRASAIGFLARPHGGEVRLRVSGEMVGGGDVAKPAADEFVGTLKRLAGLNPNETRKPQEGRMRVVVSGKQFELRIKTAGTVKGEQLAIRLIDVAASQMRLEQLGLSDDDLGDLRKALGARPGIVVLSSPKDSGLTTSMHACLRFFDRYTNNVIVFEPHVEVEVENVQHILIDQEEGPTAAAEVRSRARMEPDIIAFDSLLLPEAAQVLAEAAKDKTVVIGLRAADTGQALSRLMTLFGSTAVLAERLQLVVNQRLVRLLCPACREGYRPNPEFLRKANLSSADVNILYRPRSRTELNKEGKPIVCPQCRNDRFVGREGLFEIMPVDATIRDMIARNVSVADIRVQVRKEGMKNLQEEGLRKVIEGKTSIEEVLRAIKQAS